MRAIRLWAAATVGLPAHRGLGESERAHVAAAVDDRRPSAGARLELFGELDALGPEWDELARASGNLFATREWLQTWYRHYSTGGALLVACRSPDGRLAAILPLEVKSVRGVRVLRFLGHGPSDQMGPICAAADVGFTAEALRRVLRHPPRRFQLFVGRHLPGPEDWATIVGASCVREDATPVLRFQGETWDDVLASFGSGIRKEIRYDARRLAREHDVRHRRCDDVAALQSDLDILFRLHVANWGDRSSFMRHEAFQRDFAKLALERGWLRLWILEVDGRAVAAKLNFRFQGAEFSYQAGRDPTWTGPSLGLVTVAHAMHAAFEEGASEYRFLRGSERYKFRFPVVDAGLQTIARGSGAAAEAALAAMVALDDALGRAPSKIARKLMM